MRSLIVLIAAALAVPAVAQPAMPTADEINKVMAYYEDGKDQGPVLLEGRLCGKVDRKTKACTDPVEGTAEAKQTVELLMRWFVPKDASYDDIRIEWVHDGEIRRTSDLKISTSMNYRTWKAKQLGKAGTWEVRIRRGDDQLKTIKVEVSE